MTSRYDVMKINNNIMQSNCDTMTISDHDTAMQNVISEIKRDNEATKRDNEAIHIVNEAIMVDNTKLRELIGGYNERLMIMEGDLATSISRYNQGETNVNLA